jgi:hypothetical protein
MAGGFHSDTQEKVEAISYTPTVKDTGDLEAGTNTITATSRQGTADYNKVLTLAVPDDARLIIKRIAARLDITRDSGTSNNLYCTVSVDSPDGSANILFNGVDVQAANLQATDLTTGDVFDLLTDGAAHTFYFFFWVDSGDAVISKVQMYYGIGVNTGGQPNAYFQIAHTGLLSLQAYLTRKGSASGVFRLWAGLYTDGSWFNFPIEVHGNIQAGVTDLQVGVNNVVAKDGLTFAGYPGASTDIVCIYEMRAVLRSQQ